MSTTAEVFLFVSCRCRGRRPPLSPHLPQPTAPPPSTALWPSALCTPLHAAFTLKLNVASFQYMGCQSEYTTLHDKQSGRHDAQLSPPTGRRRHLGSIHWLLLLLLLWMLRPPLLRPRLLPPLLLLLRARLLLLHGWAWRLVLHGLRVGLLQLLQPLHVWYIKGEGTASRGPQHLTRRELQWVGEAGASAVRGGSSAAQATSTGEDRGCSLPGTAARQQDTCTQTAMAATRGLLQIPAAVCSPRGQSAP